MATIKISAFSCIDSTVAVAWNIDLSSWESNEFARPSKMQGIVKITFSKPSKYTEINFVRAELLTITALLSDDFVSALPHRMIDMRNLIIACSNTETVDVLNDQLKDDHSFAGVLLAEANTAKTLTLNAKYEQDVHFELYDVPEFSYSSDDLAQGLIVNTNVGNFVLTLNAVKSFSLKSFADSLDTEKCLANPCELLCNKLSTNNLVKHNVSFFERIYRRQQYNNASESGYIYVIDRKNNINMIVAESSLNCGSLPILTVYQNSSNQSNQSKEVIMTSDNKILMHVHLSNSSIACEVSGAKYSMKLNHSSELQLLKQAFLFICHVIVDFKIKFEINQLPRLNIYVNSKMIQSAFTKPDSISSLGLSGIDQKLVEICYTLAFKLRLIGGVMFKNTSPIFDTHEVFEDELSIRDQMVVNWQGKPLYVSPHAFYRFCQRISAVHMDGWRNPMSFLHNLLKKNKFEVKKQIHNKKFYYENSTNSVFVISEGEDSRDFITYLVGSKYSDGIDKFFGTDFNAIPLGQLNVQAIEAAFE